ncbi:uncharacterized protein DS421_16g538760 [Arachis hypogaea]|nr:uncharacterized protein DS421_16g538760 [Arachis hypogaea]
MAGTRTNNVNVSVNLSRHLSLIPVQPAPGRTPRNSGDECTGHDDFLPLSSLSISPSPFSVSFFPPQASPVFVLPLSKGMYAFIVCEIRPELSFNLGN